MPVYDVLKRKTYRNWDNATKQTGVSSANKGFRFVTWLGNANKPPSYVTQEIATRTRRLKAHMNTIANALQTAHAANTLSTVKGYTNNTRVKLLERPRNTLPSLRQQHNNYIRTHSLKNSMANPFVNRT